MVLVSVSPRFALCAVALLAETWLAGSCSSVVVDGDAGPSDRDARAEVDAADLGDGGTTGDDASIPAPAVEVGLGVDRFESVREGQTIEFAIGPQGGGRYFGTHVWGGVRVHGMNPERARVTYSISTASTAEELGSDSRLYLRLQSESGGYVGFAMTPQLTDCCKAEGAELILRVEVMDVDGNMGADERRVVGANECPPGFDGLDVCP